MPCASTDLVILAINILNMHAELASVLEKILDQIAHIPGDDPDVSYPQLVAEDLDIVLDDRLAADLKHNFRHVVGRRICPHPRAGCRYEAYVRHRIPACISQKTPCPVMDCCASNTKYSFLDNVAYSLANV